MGLHRAGFDVIGVDINPQPNYPFAFVQADALRPPFDLSVFDLIWASPPCQRYTTMGNRFPDAQAAHLDGIAPMRAILEASGVPYIIENVMGARSEMRNPVRLTGAMFGLRVHRPRLFECSELILVPPAAPPPRDQVPVYGKLDGRRLWTRADGSDLRCAGSLEEAQDAMGIDWMEWDELRESIPPAYAEFLAGARVEELNRISDRLISAQESRVRNDGTGSK